MVLPDQPQCTPRPGQLETPPKAPRAIAPQVPTRGDLAVREETRSTKFEIRNKSKWPSPECLKRPGRGGCGDSAGDGEGKFGAFSFWISGLVSYFEPRISDWAVRQSRGSRGHGVWIRLHWNAPPRRCARGPVMPGVAPRRGKSKKTCCHPGAGSIQYSVLRVAVVFIRPPRQAFGLDGPATRPPG